MEKKGLTSSVVIGLVLILVAFGILLFLFLRFENSVDVDDVICEESVSKKASVPEIFNSKDLIPLKCKTKKICISDDWIGGECEEFRGDDYGIEKVSGSIAEIKVQINEILSRKQAECWSKMGKGDLNVFSQDFNLQSDINRKCVICYRIAFDESLKNSVGQIKGLGNYMMTSKVPGKEISYWNFVTSGLDARGYDEKHDVFDMDEKAVVYMELSKSTAPVWISGVAGGGAGGVAGAYIGASIGSIVPVAGSFAGGFIGFVGGSFVGGVLGKEAGDEARDNLISEIDDTSATVNLFMDYGKISGLECRVESIA